MVDLTFQQESLSELRRELEPLFRQHWEEVALNKDTVPLDPDWEAYTVLENCRLYSFTTARAGQKLVGYVGFLVSQALHYKTLMIAEPDLIWLAPECRGGFAGNRLLRAAEAELIRIGVKRIGGREKLHCPLKGFFASEGYQAIELHHVKMVR